MRKQRMNEQMIVYREEEKPHKEGEERRTQKECVKERESLKE